MKQTSVDLALAIEGEDEGDPGADPLGGQAVGDPLPLPAPPSVISGVNPRLVDVDDSPLGLNQLQKLQGALLSLYQAPLGVALDWELDDLVVAEVEQVPHDLSDPMQLHLGARALLELAHDVFSPLDHFSVP